MSWPASTIPEHRNRQLFHDLVLTAVDSGGAFVTAGPDAAIHVTVSARTVEVRLRYYPLLCYTTPQWSPNFRHGCWWRRNRRR